MTAPILTDDEYSLLIAEHSTGTVLNSDLTVHKSGESCDQVFLIFKDFKKAEDFVSTLTLTRPELECVLYDKSGKYVATFDKFNSI
jgi:hypothetical protein